jgi:hypothetical protein
MNKKLIIIVLSLAFLPFGIFADGTYEISDGLYLMDEEGEFLTKKPPQKKRKVPTYNNLSDINWDNPSDTLSTYSSTRAIEYENNNLYIGYNNPATIDQYSLSDEQKLISNSELVGSYGGSFDNSPFLTSLDVSNNGNKLLLSNYWDGAVYEYSIGSNYDITTLSSAIDSKDLFDDGFGRFGAFIVDEDNKKMVAINSSSNGFIETHNFDNLFDLSTLNLWDSSNTGFNGTYGVDLNKSGEMMFYTHKSQSKIVLYELSTPFKSSTKTVSKKSYLSFAPYNIRIIEEKGWVLLVDISNSLIRQYNVQSLKVD